MRKVFLDDLPRIYLAGRECIDWKSSIRHKVEFIYDNIKGEVIIISYKSGYLYIQYLNKPTFKIFSGSFTNCRIGGLLCLKTSEFKIEIGTIFKDKNRDIIITDREIRVKHKKDNSKENQKWYRYTCNKCGWTEGWIIEGSLGENGCSCCDNKIVVEHINSIVAKEETQWMIPYFQGGYDEAKLYSYGSGKKIYPICPDCGRVKDKSMPICTLFKNQSIACTCSDKISYPNKVSYSLLDQLNEIYRFDYLEHEYSPKWIDKMSYDNYFVYNSKEYILEMDGYFHYKNNHMNGKSKEESKAIDVYKDKLAKEHNIEVVRINCIKSELEFIKQNIINSKLNKLFDLDKVTWNDVEEFALSNLVKVACDYWENGMHDTKEISKIMKIHRGTVIKYLKKGSKIWEWCDYDAREELCKNAGENGKASGKQVEVFKNDELLGSFSSCSDLSRKSEELFGVKLYSNLISKVCIGKRNHHKGFTFKYINEIEQAI